MQVTKAVVPAAGLGTRLYPVTRSQPKEMLPLGDRPTIQGVAEEIEGAGITDVLLITSAAKQAIEDHFDPRNDLSDPHADPSAYPLQARYYYTRQKSPKGLGDAVLHGREFVGQEHFIVALGDCVLLSPDPSGPVKRMVQAHVDFEADATIVMQMVDAKGTAKYGIADPGEELAEGVIELADIVEKPGPENAPSRMAVAARYIFSPRIFELLEGIGLGHGKEIQLTDAIRALIAEGGRVLAVQLRTGELRLDVGDFVSYGRGFMRSMLTHREYGPKLRRYANALLAHLGDATQPDPDVPTDDQL